MLDKNLKFLNTIPPVSEFINFRTKCGWGIINFETAQKTLDASLVGVTIYDKDQIVGFGRVIGDGAIYFYVQDLIVDNLYRGRGLGTEILRRLIEQVREIALRGASISLMSAIDKEKFYERFGFISRPSSKYGAGMKLLLNL